MQSFSIIGGDQRQARLARLLLQDGHEVYTWALPLQATQTTDSLEDTAARGHCVIWPVPMLTKDGFLNVAGTSLDSSYALTNLRSDQVAVGGRISASLLQQAEENGLTLVDYTSREDFAIANAVPTALTI